jgi:uncharacterized protein
LGLIYLDSCIVIYLVERKEPWRSTLAGMMRQEPETVFCISDLVRLECLVRPLREDDGLRIAAFRRAFDSFRILPIPEPVFDRAARLRADHRLRTPDALHLACALHHGCDRLWTNDARLSAASDGVAQALSPQAG